MMSSPQAGFNGVHVARDDWQEQGQRNSARTIEMIWAPSPTLGMAGATYMGVLYGGYCTIGGIDMSEGSNDAPIMDDLSLEDSNIGAVVDGVISRVMDNIKQYPQGEPGGDGTADVMFPLGCDFEWERVQIAGAQCRCRRRHHRSPPLGARRSPPAARLPPLPPSPLGVCPRFLIIDSPHPHPTLTPATGTPAPGLRTRTSSCTGLTRMAA